MSLSRSRTRANALVDADAAVMFIEAERDGESYDHGFTADMAELLVFARTQRIARYRPKRATRVDLVRGIDPSSEVESAADSEGPKSIGS